MNESVSQKQGTLITIEGIDGSGKSTAAQALYEKLTPVMRVILTKEPGATTLGSYLRKILQNRDIAVCDKAEYLLFAADRAHHMEHIVVPALKKGITVISDRMADSSYAYQGFGRGLDPEMILQINRWAMMGYEPDVTIYLELDYDTAVRRLNKRNEVATVFEQEKEDFFNRVIQGFEAAFKKRPSVIRIDARRSEQHVNQILQEAVHNHFNKQDRDNDSSSSILMDRT